MKPSSFLFLILSMLTPCFQVSAQVNSDQANEEEVIRIMRRNRELSDALDRRRAKLGGRTGSMVRALIRGDYSKVDEAAAQKDVDALWYVFGRAVTNDIGYGEMLKIYPDRKEALAQCKALNKKIASYLRPKIAEIPGHAKKRGDLIEMMSQEVGYFDQRPGTLRQLGLLGSMEAIQQIGRFLEDSRNPDLAINSFMVDSGLGPTEPNFVGASYAMIKALGDASPVQLTKALSLPESGRLTLLQWWKSDAAKPYREWTYETEQSMPPPRPRAVVATPPKAPDRDVVAPKPLPVFPAADEPRMLPWLLGVVVVAGVSLAILLAVRGRRKP